jgi:hypothetical protein
MGAEPAFTLVLHAWTQELRRHLHAHVLIVCGDLDEQGNWVGPKRNPRFLCPVHALSQVFRAKFLDALDAIVLSDIGHRHGSTEKRINLIQLAARLPPVLQ